MFIFFNTDFLVSDSLECDLYVTETMEKLLENKHISSQIKVSKVLVENEGLLKIALTLTVPLSF